MNSIAKTGRPRLIGERYASGKLRSRAREADTTPPAKIRRAVDLALHGAADPALATALGWMRLHGKLNDAHVAAGVAYARMRGQADRALGLPRRSTASPSYEAGFGNSGHTAEPRNHDKANARFEKMRAVILDAPAGFRMIEVLDSACLMGNAVPYWEEGRLRDGLRICAQHLGFGTSPAKTS